MTITREQVADLREGDVVEIETPAWGGFSCRGIVREQGGRLYVGPTWLADSSGHPRLSDDHSLTVVSRAPRPLYVNRPRSKPVPGDVVRSANPHTTSDVTWAYFIDGGWIKVRTGCAVPRDVMPEDLRLLVDGETGQVVP